MSLKIIEDEIARFLESPDAEVLCITGPWGAGKTFTWVKFLENAKSIALENYAYVSLFGQNSLQDVRSSIFENTRPSKPASGKKGGTRIQSLLRRIGRDASKYRHAMKGIAPEGALVISERLMFASLKPQIVCIDDMERAGEGLSARDILGLVNQLKEEKKCKVVMLLNSAAIEDEEFNRQVEKVADNILVFEPTAGEAAKIGISNSAPEAELLRSHVEKLDIRNIRTIQRIEAICKRLEEELDDHDVRVRKQAYHTAALFAFSKYQPDDAPTPEFIREFNRLSFLDEDEEEEDTPDWRALLANYDFGHLDEFDLAVAKGIVDGYFDRSLLRERAARQQKTFQLQDKDNSYQEAWDRYHHSFDDDQETVLDQMAEAFKKCIEAISPLNANGTAKFFKELGRPEQSRRLAQYYVQHRDEPQEFWDLEASAFGSEIQDPDIRELFREKYESFEPEAEDPGEVLLRINRRSGWNHKDIVSLSQMTAADFYQLFKNTRGRELVRITTECMRFRIRGEGSTERQIYERANDALDQIAAESDINARRVQQHRSRG